MRAKSRLTVTFPPAKPSGCTLTATAAIPELPGPTVQLMAESFRLAMRQTLPPIDTCRVDLRCCVAVSTQAVGQMLEQDQLSYYMVFINFTYPVECSCRIKAAY